MFPLERVRHQKDDGTQNVEGVGNLSISNLSLSLFNSSNTGILGDSNADKTCGSKGGGKKMLANFWTFAIVRLQWIPWSWWCLLTLENLQFEMLLTRTGAGFRRSNNIAAQRSSSIAGGNIRFRDVIAIHNNLESSS